MKKTNEDQQASHLSVRCCLPMMLVVLEAILQVSGELAKDKGTMLRLA